jgi:DNA-binding NarL/FixJ family response regulator
MKVFIADDSPIVRERLGSLVGEVKGVEVIGQAGDVAEALAGIRRLRPDVVILDIQMPGGSGIEVLRQVKGEYQNCIVIMLTNYPYPQYRKRCMEAGADFFFDKSSEFEEAVRVLARLVENRQKGKGDVC